MKSYVYVMRDSEDGIIGVFSSLLKTYEALSDKILLSRDKKIYHNGEMVPLKRELFKGNVIQVDATNSYNMIIEYTIYKMRFNEY